MGLLDKIKASVRVETPEGRLYVKYCSEFGLDPNMLGQKCEYNNQVYTVAGLSKRGRLFYVCLKNDNFELPIDIATLKNPKKVKML